MNLRMAVDSFTEETMSEFLEDCLSLEFEYPAITEHPDENEASLLPGPSQSEERPSNCPPCSTWIVENCSLGGILISHRESKPQEDTNCSNTSYQGNNLQQNSLISTDINILPGTVSNKEFSQDGHLHKQNKSHLRKESHICDQCGKAYTRETDLKRHMLKATCQMLHFCTSCDKSFKKKDSLQQHQLIHTGEKPFVCRFCSKAFSSSSHLKRHRLVHTGNKPHTCNVCGKAFIQKYSLTQHLLIHNIEKPHVCDVCCKAFSWRTSLMKHLSVHKRDLETQPCP